MSAKPRQTAGNAAAGSGYRALRSPALPSRGSIAPALSRAEERRLVELARRGDARALRNLLETLSHPIRRFATGFCRHHEDAEDVMQDVLTSLVRALPRFRGESSLSTWAFTVARHACLRHRRRGAHEPERLERLDVEDRTAGGALDLPDRSRGPHDELERSELQQLLQSAIAALPPAQREVLVLRDVEGFPASEVGRILGLGERAVKSRLHRARMALREALAPYLAGDSPAPRPGCPRTALLLSRYFEGEMDAGTCRRLEAHVSTCPGCEAACDTLRAALAACRRWGAAKPTPTDRAAIRRAVGRVVSGGPRP